MAENERKDLLKNLTQQVENELTQLYDSEKFKNYLQTMAAFPHYSADNTLLIFFQNPTASMVMGFKSWKKLNRIVQKGQKAIYIKAPLIKNENLLDKEGHIVKDEKGQPKQEKRLVGFRYVPVFDVQQTAGEPITRTQDFVSSNLDTSENINKLYLATKEYINIHTDVKVHEEAYDDQSRGFYRPKDHTITINGKESNPTLKLKTLIHEFAHSQLHQINTTGSKLPREHKETQAEAVAYTTLKSIGIDTSGYSLGYIATWAKDKELMKQSLKEIQKVVGDTTTLISTVIQENAIKLTNKIYDAEMERDTLADSSLMNVNIDPYKVLTSRFFEKMTDSESVFELFDVDKGEFFSATYDVKNKVFTAGGEDYNIVDFLKDNPKVILTNLLSSDGYLNQGLNAFSQNFYLKDANSRPELIDSTSNKVIQEFESFDEAKAFYDNFALKQSKNLESYIDSFVSPINKADFNAAATFAIEKLIDTERAQAIERRVPDGVLPKDENGTLIMSIVIEEEPTLNSLDELKEALTHSELGMGILGQKLSMNIVKQISNMSESQYQNSHFRLKDNNIPILSYGPDSDASLVANPKTCDYLLHGESEKKYMQTALLKLKIKDLTPNVMIENVRKCPLHTDKENSFNTYAVKAKGNEYLISDTTGHISYLQKNQTVNLAEILAKTSSVQSATIEKQVTLDKQQQKLHTPVSPSL